MKMGSLLLKRSSLQSLFHSLHPKTTLPHVPQANSDPILTCCIKNLLKKNNLCSETQNYKSPSLFCNSLILPSSGIRHFSSQVVVEPQTSDGLTVDDIVASRWTILDESDSDWKNHAASIAQSIHLIKKRLQWKKLVVRLEMLSLELNKPNLWDDPVHAGKISREHGLLMGKMKEVNGYERELLEHIDMLKLAREENDKELESVRFRFVFLLGMYFHLRVIYVY
ncbi:hypothetical protein IFM89_000671 [Coptis chinensis]|uniref:Peptide chain release factor 2 n=1 Tax=Coptis chinensis TaxID=261450 RepID=A0A835M6G8_9MAGN|nr:hypothetical protein IFM89_000671 [Coptis chinensis]